MSVELQKIKKRIGATDQIRKVTSAMQRVASARLMNDRKALEASTQYTERLTELLKDISSTVRDVDHPLLKEKPEGPATIVVFGSERGLCGGFTSSLVNEIEAFVARDPSRATRFITVGKVINQRVRRMGLEVAQHMPQPGMRTRAETLDTITGQVVDTFLNTDCSEVYVLFSRFVSGLRQVASVWRVLPVPFTPFGGGRLNAALFEPDAARMLYGLLPEFVRQMIDFAFISSSVSENAARQMAMSRATDNATEMLNQLRASHRRLRQEDITTEMLELIGGRSLG